MKSLYRLRYWSPETSKVKEKLFLKKTILVGSDSHCDLVMPDMAGLEARIDFESGDIENLVSGLQEKISPKELFQIQKTIFQWSRLGFPFKSGKTLVLMGSIMAMVIVTAVWMSRSDASKTFCRGLAADFSKPIWRGSSPEMQEAMAMRRNAAEAMREGQYSRAQIEIESLSERLRPFHQGPSCGPQAVISRLARDYIWALARDTKVSNSLAERFSIFQKFLGLLTASDRDSLMPKLMRLIRKKYLQGYRLSEQDSRQGEQMIDEAESACETLGLRSDCYRPQTSHQIEKEPS